MWGICKCGMNEIHRKRWPLRGKVNRLVNFEFIDGKSGWVFQLLNRFGGNYGVFIGSVLIPVVKKKAGGGERGKIGDSVLRRRYVATSHLKFKSVRRNPFTPPPSSSLPIPPPPRSDMFNSIKLIHLVEVATAAGVSIATLTHWLEFREKNQI